ncbi:MAG: exodeoxyribonuclease III [Geminicoccaceae bacterium]|nr:exodeoxyribonuclease III [Geminicoccaceae bacterium]
MRVATWNVNSIRKRQEIVLAWLKRTGPDVLLLQETKVQDDGFPRLLFEAEGWHLALHGQKGGRNGVAILARAPIEGVCLGLPGGDADDQARWIEGTVNGTRVVSVYVPNGTGVDSPNFPYKLAFFDRMSSHMADLRRTHERAVVGGDFNVAPEPLDVNDPVGSEGHICFHPDERRRMRALLNAGWYDAFRSAHPNAKRFSWWDLRAGSFERDEGLRIDHLLLTPAALDRLDDAGMDRDERAKRGVSDHVPVWAALGD